MPKMSKKEKKKMEAEAAQRCARSSLCLGARPPVATLPANSPLPSLRHPDPPP
eukprot:COSAG04_NODE_25955_length_301_cov_1.009901_1_plen_52_part_01